MKVFRNSPPLTRRPVTSSSKAPSPGMPVPMHPGAQKYFDEKGVKKQGS